MPPALLLREVSRPRFRTCLPAQAYLPFLQAASPVSRFLLPVRLVRFPRLCQVVQHTHPIHLDPVAQKDTLLPEAVLLREWTSGEEAAS